MQPMNYFWVIEGETGREAGGDSRGWFISKITFRKGFIGEAG